MNKKINILVLEDELSLLNAIKLKLKKNNFSVLTSRTCKNALNILKESEKIDVIWLDHYLLGGDSGLDFVLNLKQDDRYKKIPIFLVSNTATKKKINSYIALGIKEYYVKSNYKLEEIIEDIKENLNIK